MSGRRFLAWSGRVDAASGDVLLAVQPSGAYEVRFAQVSIALQTEAGPGTMVMDAVGTGSYRESAPGILTASATHFSGTMILTLGDQTFTNNDDHDTDEGTPSPFECSGGRLRLALGGAGDGGVQFPVRAAVGCKPAARNEVDSEWRGFVPLTASRVQHPAVCGLGVAS